jgi:hypothetical protein
MPRTAMTDEQKAAAKAAKVASGIDVERPKSVLVKYRNESDEVVAAVNVDTEGEIQLFTNGWITLSDVQLRNMRSHISKSINSRTEKA